MASKIERAWKEYEEAVYSYAEERFEKVVKPWLVKKGYSFVTGNGEYYIFTGKQNFCYGDLPKRIQEVLDIEVPGMPGNDLGTLMPNYIHLEKK